MSWWFVAYIVIMGLATVTLLAIWLTRLPSGRRNRTRRRHRR